MSLVDVAPVAPTRNATRALQLVVVALVIATASRFLDALGVPGIIDFIHIPFVLAAVAVATPEIRHTTATRKACFWLGVLFVDGLVASVDTGGAIIRPVIGWLLLAEPLLLAVAVIASLLSLPVRDRRLAARRLENVVVLIALAQVPFALVQVATSGVGDHVQGTFVGLGSGAHIAGAVTLLGAIALSARAMTERKHITITLVVAAVLVGVTIIADAKQVLIAAVPALLVLAFASKVLEGRSAVVRKLAALGVLAVTAAALLAFAASYRPLHQAGGEATVAKGPRGKIVAFDSIRAQMDTRPETYLVGLGAGNTVGKLATLTVGSGLKANSPVAFLHLKQSPLTAEVLSLDKSNYITASSSVWSGLSSLLGLFGDFGIVGFAAYCLAWFALVSSGNGTKGPHRAVVLCLVVLAGLLGVFHIWLEEPNIMLPLAALLATAATAAIASTEDANRAQISLPPSVGERNHLDR